MKPQVATISVDQFIAAPRARVWRALTEPELHARWWAPGDIAATVGHRFHLEMPGWGSIPCEVLEVEFEQRLVYPSIRTGLSPGAWFPKGQVHARS